MGYDCRYVEGWKCRLNQVSIEDCKLCGYLRLKLEHIDKLVLRVEKLEKLVCHQKTLS